VGDLCGAAEIGAHLGVSRQRVQQLEARDDFPKPLAELKADGEGMGHRRRARLGRSPGPSTDRLTAKTKNPQASPPTGGAFSACPKERPVPTSFPMSIPHAPTGFVNQAALDNAYTVPINDLYGVVAAVLPLQFRIQYTQTTGGQALTNGAFTTITAYNGTADVDSFGGSTFNATTGVWTCPAAGAYEISGQVTASAGAARIISAVAKNGTVIYSAYNSGAGTTLASASLPPKEFTLAANDTIVLQANVNAAAIVTGVQNGNGSFLHIRRIA
jgi:hypothetical protein